MNIFVVFNDEVVTPSTAGTILKGITRDSALAIIRSKGLKCTEREISIDEVLDRYNNGELIEIFGTGTAALIANVDEIMFDVSKVDLHAGQMEPF
jgi:branched-chain amino acid aminotransferase